MSKPLTISESEEREWRADGMYPGGPYVKDRLFVEVDALRAALAAAEAQLADERRHADALKEGLAACVGERATFYAGQTQTVTWAVAIEHAERLLSDHRARRAAEVK